MHNSTNANAVEIPNTIAPTAMDKINPNKLSTAREVSTYAKHKTNALKDHDKKYDRK